MKLNVVNEVILFKTFVVRMTSVLNIEANCV